MKRSVILADMNSFFASCHAAEKPELANQEVIVAGKHEKRTGIVLAASYPAKYKGVKTGMLLREAQQLCPDGYFFHPDFALYIEYSARILNIMRSFTDQVESFSIDEAFIEATNITNLWGPPLEIATKLKNKIINEVGVMCSIGIGPNKLIAKMAAGLKKPNGLTQIPSIEEYQRVFWPMPVEKLFGVGPRYKKHLNNFNIKTIGDLANLPVDILKRRWGKNGEMLHYLAYGIDNSPVDPASLDENKSIGNQKTLSKDHYGREIIKVPILEICEEVGYRARQGGYMGRTVTLTLRDSSLKFFPRSKSITHYTDLTEEIYEIACHILLKHWDESSAVRLVGVTLSNLIKKSFIQGDILGQRIRLSNLNKACDTVKNRFGENVIKRGKLLI